MISHKEKNKNPHLQDKRSTTWLNVVDDIYSRS